MWIRALASIVLGLFFYVGSSLMFNNIITGTSQSAIITRQVTPVAIACVVVTIAAIGLFHHS